MEATYQKLLEVENLSVAFRQGQRVTLAVDRVSFEIKKGETVALVGESGSGKSVTALSVLKLLPYPAAHHPSGAIRFKGQDHLHLSEAEIRRVRGNDITIIFQEPMTSLNPLHTIEKQIGEILLLHRGLTGEAAMQQQDLADLLLDGVQRIERGHRLLEDDGDVVAAHVANFRFRQAQQMLSLEV